MIDIEALEREAAAEEEAAGKVKLSEEDKRIAAAFAKKAKAREERAAVEKQRRANDLNLRLAAARASVEPGVLLAGVDLVDLFPLGEAPDAGLLPGRGVLIVRDPVNGLGGFHREIEHKKKDVWEVYADLLCTPGNVVDPDIEKDPTEGMKLRGACDRYNGMAIGAGDIVAKLGGSKAQADKRGRA
jgi:hypothetical protein